MTQYDHSDHIAKEMEKSKKQTLKGFRGVKMTNKKTGQVEYLAGD